MPKSNTKVIFENIFKDIKDFISQFFILSLTPLIYLVIFKGYSIFKIKELILESVNYLDFNDKIIYSLIAYILSAFIIALIILVIRFIFNLKKPKNEKDATNFHRILISCSFIFKKILSSMVDVCPVLLVGITYITISYFNLDLNEKNEVNSKENVENLICILWRTVSIMSIFFIFIKNYITFRIDNLIEKSKSKSSSQNLPNNKETTPCEVSGTTPLEAVFPQLKLANSKKQETIADLITHSCVWAHDEYEVKLKDPENLKIELILVPKQSDTNQPQKSAEKTEK